MGTGGTLLALLSACGGVAQPEGDTLLPATFKAEQSFVCSDSCPACPAGTVCAGESAYNKGYQPTCLQTCDYSGSCPAGMRCAALFGEFIRGRVCVSDTFPIACRPPESGFHCDFPPASCANDILVLPFSEPANFTCGHEYRRCEKGCRPPANGTPAHCK